MRTTYAFNTEAAAAVSSMDDHDDDDDDDHHHHPTNHNNRDDDDDRDGLFHSHNRETNNQPRSQPCRTTVVILIILTLIGINLTLLLLLLFPPNSNASPSSSQQQPLPQKVSTLLNNALIPRWKPRPSSSDDFNLTNIAFGSCASQNMPQSFWDTLLSPSSQQPPYDLFIYTGDNVYGDCRSEDCMELKMAYYNLSLHPSIQGAASQIPVLATLDDHDYGMNNCHGDNPYKITAKALFQEFFNYTWDDLPYHDGVYQSYTYGTKSRQRIQVLLLDTRYDRSAFSETNDVNAPYRPKETDDMDQQMLGEFQWKWLTTQIDNEPDVVLRIIVSSIQVLNDVTGFEAWRHLPMEQERLYRLLQNEPVIFVSGDRHVGAIYERPKATGHKFVEITASSLTHSIPFGAFNSCNSSEDCDEPSGATRVSGPLVRENHYGTIAIDYAAEQVTISLRRAESRPGSTYHHQSQAPQGDAGEVLISRTYSWSEL